MERRLVIIQGDITLLPLRQGAIVNPSNTGLILTSRGVGQQIQRRAGPFIQQTLHTERSKLRGGRIEAGQAVDTDPGQLQIRRLIHVAIVGARKINARLISRCLLSAYDLADELELEQLAIPPLGPGITRFPMDEFLDIFWKISSEELPRLEHVKEVYLCLNEQEDFELAHQYAREHAHEFPESVRLEISEEGIGLGMFSSQFQNF